MFKSTATLALVMGLAGAPPASLAGAPHGQAIALQKAEAPVTGTVTVKHEGSKVSLVFSEDFTTNPKAPALQVVLLKSATPLKTLTAPQYPLTPGSYTQVAPLKSYKGAQSYTLPAGVDIKASGSVLIWCPVGCLPIGAE
jgi:hypothetical protein